VTVVDAHHHLWDPALGSYPWMTDELSAIRRPFLPADLLPLLDEASVERTIVVQARADRAESEWLLELARENELISGVVGWVDLASDQVEREIADLQASAGGTKLVGIRHPAHDEADPEWLLREDVRRGIAAVSAAGLVFELLVRTRELPAACTVASSLPDTTFVIDHLAKPGPEPAPDWSTWMRALSELPNVYAKLSGLVTEASWTDWTASDFASTVGEAVALFGPERLLFGSDWPVCLLAASYAEVVELARGLVADLDERDRRLVFGQNALRIYGIAA
jgi:L-fuconolactonase